MNYESFESKMEEEKEVAKRKKNVMVVIDESQSSYHALMWVLNNFKESIQNLQLVIFAAQPLPNLINTLPASVGFGHLYPVSAISYLIKSAQEQNKKVSLGLLEKAKNICARQGVYAETSIEAGDPKEAICSAVQKYETNQLVIGDHANTILKGAFHGSFSSHCLQNANCPVLVAKKPELK